MPAAGALIVGGGPAGAACAITLARGGVRARVLERTREPADALCGGFLSWRTVAALARLGIDADALSPAVVRRVRLFAGGGVAESPLPHPGRAVSRRRLDALMLDAAAKAGAGVERGVTVRAIDGRGAVVEGDSIRADALFLASGKHEVRGAARDVATRGDPTLGLRVRLAASPALARLVGDAVELHLFDGGYAGLVVQEDGSANLCMAVRRSRLREAGDPPALLRALANGPLGDRLAGLDGEPVDAVANVPYGWRVRAGDGRYRLGDQAGVIPSLAGEGMGIAVASGVSAARAHLRGVGPDAWQRAFARRLARPIRLADAVRAAAERPLPARAMVGAAGSMPGLIQVMARATRVAHDDA